MSSKDSSSSAMPSKDSSSSDMPVKDSSSSAMPVKDSSAYLSDVICTGLIRMALSPCFTEISHERRKDIYGRRENS